MATVAPALDAHEKHGADDTVSQDIMVPGKDPPGATDTNLSTAKGGRNYVKKLMEEKQSNKGWADGLRSEVLEKYLPRFKTAWFGASREVEVTEVMRDCLQEYFFQFPNDIADPSDTASDPTILKPYDAKAEYPLARLSPDKEKARQKCIESKKKQIREWLRYRVTRLTNSASGPDQISADGKKLVGLRKPRKKRQGYQQWQVDNREILEKEAQSLWQARIDDPDDNDAQEGMKLPQAFRQHVARLMFHCLNVEEQEHYEKRAVLAKQMEQQAFEEALKQVPTPSPEMLQSTIDNLPAFLTPVMENVRKHTGLMMVVYAFGPMPSEKGELGCITISSGKNLEVTPVSFVKRDPQAVRAHRARLLKYAASAFTKEDMDRARPGGGATIHSRAIIDETQENSPTSADVPVLYPSTKGKGKKASQRRLQSPEKRGDDSDEFTADDESDEADSDVSDRMEVDVSGEGSSGSNKRSREGDMTDLDDDDTPRPAKRTPLMSAYEIQREANIIRNKAALKALGLDPESTAKRLGFTRKQAKKKRSRNDKENNGSVVPARRSPRQVGPTPIIPLAPAPSQPEVNQSKEIPAASHPPKEPLASALIDPLDNTGYSDFEVSTPTSPARVPIPSSAARSPTPTQSSSAVPDLGDGTDGATCLGDGDLPASKEGEDDEVDIFEEAMVAEEEAPDWIGEPLKFFKDTDLGAEWRALLANWVLLEREADFVRPLHFLPKSGRPDLLGTWIIDGRLTRNKAMPYLDIGKVADFVAQYEGWWEAMQPKWRKCEGTGWTRPKYRGKDCGILNTRGQNGWLSVMVCLWWWGVAVSSAGDEEGFGMWEERVRDALWMLEIVRTQGEREG